MPHVRRLLLIAAAGSLLLGGCAGAAAEEPAQTLAPLPDLPAPPAVAQAPAGPGDAEGVAEEAEANKIAAPDSTGISEADRAAVDEALVRYLAGIEELRSDLTAPITDLYGLTRGSQTEEWLGIIQFERTESLVLDGNARVVSSTVTAGEGGTWEVTACLDISTYQLYYPDGTPRPRDADYPERNVNYVTFERFEGALYVIDDIATKEAC